MSELEPWPQAPILASLPATAQLTPHFDTAELLADLQTLRTTEWLPPQIISGEGLRPGVDVDWRKLPLRSVGGDPERTDPGGPSLAEFADTPWLGKAPHMALLLAGIPAPLRCVRLQSLGPGAESPLHNDTKYGLPWGIVRLHVPLITTPGATLTIEQETYRWQPGEFWYADFTRPHLVRNVDDITRVHLVIDCEPTPELLELFPPEFRTPEVLDHTLLSLPVRQVTPAGLAAYRCTFPMPDSFTEFDEADGAFLTSPRTRTAAVEVRDGQLILSLSGKPEFMLVHVGAGEFRFAGWTTERTVQFTRDAYNRPSVTLRSRVGDQIRALTLTAGLLECI
ncbi:aspartyl/asparaginyl beta-hydroxylase domain-containing protein [Streptomyces spiramyceticus]|uniref:aspartyl/asparaginyl beta-hydroxylase domain-containing protein n=1 Tax=Streptomyces spiramyceticus TaxID=299717 RepID=UPI00237AFC08|nr:aspartyl/asparaginyl beta-hydroxylase domain-containing protein [Streptomyces spiramyceticus]